MQINVAIDTRPFEQINRKREKRLAYAVVNALNNTGTRIQQAEEKHVRSKFQVRKADFFFGSPGRPGGVAAKLKKASVGKSRPFAELFVGGTSKGGQLLLPEFEEGGTRRPFTPGAKQVAVPKLGSPARPSISRGVPPQFTFKGLKFRGFVRGKRAALRRRRRGRTVNETVFGEFGRVRASSFTEAIGNKRVQWKGAERTFVVPEVGVIQRIGPDRGDTRRIWGFGDPFPIDDRLDFVKTAVQVADQWFHEEMERETVKALVFAR
jgi:hypothetical protein